MTRWSGLNTQRVVLRARSLCQIIGNGAHGVTRPTRPGTDGVRVDELPPEIEEMLPTYPLWLQHGEVITRLLTALEDLGQDLCFARHPLRWLGKAILQADRPLETLNRHLNRAAELLDSIENALEICGTAGYRKWQLRVMQKPA